MTFAPAKLKIATSNNLGEELHLQESTFFEGHTNVAQYPLHHVAYLPARFEVATSSG